MAFLFNRSGGAGDSFEHLTLSDYRSQYVEPEVEHILLDVRTTGEFREGHVPGAVNIPLDQLERRVKEVPAGKPVVVICATGNRSQTGARILAGAGYEQVFNLKRGTMGWMMAGLPLEG